MKMNYLSYLKTNTLFILYVLIIFELDYFHTTNLQNPFSPIALVAPPGKTKNNASRDHTPKERQTKGLSGGFTLYTPRPSPL